MQHRSSRRWTNVRVEHALGDDYIRDRYETGEPPPPSLHIYAEDFGALAQSGTSRTYETRAHPHHVYPGERDHVLRITKLTPDEVALVEQRWQQEIEDFDQLYRRHLRALRRRR